MSKLNEIQKKLLEIDATKFHKLVDTYLNKKYDYNIQSIGTKIAEDKPAKGTPDTLIPLDNGQYIFVEYTTQKTNIVKKFLEDIGKCFDVDKTGIEISKIDKIILASNSKLSTKNIETLNNACSNITCEILTNSSLSYEINNHFPTISREFLDIALLEEIKVKLPPDINERLQNSIQREIENDILNTLLNVDNKIIFIQGEEGTGKTILALQLLQKLPKKEYIVRFFKSNEWEDSVSVENLLLQDNSNTLNSVIVEESKNIIICLDGVNERGALRALMKILESFRHLSEDVKAKIQIIFTTRDLSSYALYRSNELKQYPKIILEKFTDKELEGAIFKIDPQYVFEDFPNELKSIAAIPRYLNLAFQLKDKLGGYTNISKEILYWEGLKEQIENDSKIREQGFTETSDIESVLLEVCKSITIKNNKAIINQESFKVYFGDDYRKVKTPFIESRMVTSSDSTQIELNFNMVVVAYAIYILTLFNEIDTSFGIEEIADFFKEKLEPYVNDSMSLVPFIVFQLSLDKDISIEEGKLSKIYAGLLYLWFDNQNSNIDIENLEYWCKKDFVSFIRILDIIELKHINFNRLSLKNGMLEILSSIWSATEGQDTNLNQYLNKLLVIDSHENNNKLLIRRAIRIIYAYPLEVFFDKILDMRVIPIGIDTNDDLRTQLAINNYVSILLRFGYKEDIFEYLLSDRKYNAFISMFQSYELSVKIGESIDDNISCYRVKKIEEIQHGQEVFENFTIENIHQYIIPSISCRKDLTLNSNDKIVIKSTLGKLSDSYKPSKTMDGGRIEQVDIDFLELLASYNVDDFNATKQKFLYASVSQKAMLKDIEKFDLCILPDNELAVFIIDNLDYLLESDNQSDKDRYIDKMIDIMLFSADESRLLQFFDWIIDKSCSACLSKDVASYIKPIISDSLLTLICQKIENYYINSMSDPKLYEQYMTYLFILKDYKNQYLKDWIIDIASKSNEKLNEFHAEVFVVVLEASEYISYIDIVPSSGNYLSYWITKEKDYFNDKSFKELEDFLPIDIIGELLCKNERYDEITEWGIALFTSYESFKIMQYFNIEEPIKVFAENNEELFVEYAKRFLKEVTNIGFIFTGGLKDIVIKQLMLYDFQKAMKFYFSEDRKNGDSNVIKKLFDIDEFPTTEHKAYREEIILNAKNDLEYLNIVIIAFLGLTDNELLEFCKKLLESKYAKDRLKSISMLVWFATDKTIDILNSLKVNDDSQYVRKYAIWAEQVSLQEKYTREICKELFKEGNISLVSPKMYQIQNRISPTFRFWGTQLIEKCQKSDKSEFDRVVLDRFLHRTEEQRKIKDSLEIFGRKLSKYYCGEKIDSDLKYILSMD